MGWFWLEVPRVPGALSGICCLRVLPRTGSGSEEEVTEPWMRGLGFGLWQRVTLGGLEATVVLSDVSPDVAFRGVLITLAIT